MNEKDLISRKDAIDAIVKQLGIKDESFLTEQEKTIVKVFRGMPSAQTDVIRCGECKHHEDEELGMVYCPIIVSNWVRDDWYCADAERRTDE